jgi:hypothetical protein
LTDASVSVKVASNDNNPLVRAETTGNIGLSSLSKHIFDAQISATFAIDIS